MTRSTSTHNAVPEIIPVDGKSYIYRLAESGGALTYVAKNRTVYSKNVVTDSDINFNMNHKFANRGKAGCFDVQTVFLHEAGHTLGLKDISSPKTAVMYDTDSTGTERRTLTQDEINALAVAYN